MTWARFDDGYTHPTFDFGRWREIMPLSSFSEEHRERIMAQVRQPKPPPKMHTITDNGFPLAQIPNRAWLEWHRARGIDPDRIREPLPSSTREYVINRDGYVCGLCGGAVAPDDVHIDHIKPWSLGGADTPDNLQVAHSTCNIRKGNRV